MEIRFVADKFELKLDRDELVALEEALDLATSSEGKSYVSGDYTDVGNHMAGIITATLRRTE